MPNDITYQFMYDDGASSAYQVALESQHTLALHEAGNGGRSGRKEGDDWTRLGHHQCEHCPLSTEEYRDCPLALALKPVLEQFGHMASHTGVAVRVISEERIITKETTMQRAVGSLFGLISAFSGCPHTTLLRPLARFHLPFSSTEESVVRVLGFYLAGQYVREQHRISADWPLDGLRALYQNLRKVNRGISHRIRGIPSDDATPNSMVLLDVLAADIAYTLELYDGELDEVFREFLDAP